MKTKKSLEAAKAEALKLSQDFPSILYRVMDKRENRQLPVGLSGSTESASSTDTTL